MSETILTVAGWLVTAFFIATGGLIKMIFTRLHKHETTHDNIYRSVANLRVHAAQTFTTKDDIKEMQKNLSSQLNRIEDKLDRKVDK